MIIIPEGGEAESFRALSSSIALSAALTFQWFQGLPCFFSSRVWILSLGDKTDLGEGVTGLEEHSTRLGEESTGFAEGAIGETVAYHFL